MCLLLLIQVVYDVRSGEVVLHAGGGNNNPVMQGQYQAGQYQVPNQYPAGQYPAAQNHQADQYQVPPYSATATQSNSF